MLEKIIKHDIFTRVKYQVVVTSLKIAIAIATYSLKKYSDVLLYDRNIIGPSSEMFGDLRKSSVIFGKCSEHVRKRSSSLRNNFGKSSKTSLLVCLYNKQNITCPLVDMNFIF